MNMSHPARHDPFSIEPITDLFQGLLRPLRALTAGGEPGLSDIRIDVSESNTAYEVKADLPGVKKEDIDVRVDGNIVSIAAKVERGAEQKESGRVIRSERYSGTVQRTFSLASDIDESAVAARYENGTLELTLPKKAGSAQKKIPIN
jgi:HSP20 family protein